MGNVENNERQDFFVYLKQGQNVMSKQPKKPTLGDVHPALLNPAARLRTAVAAVYGSMQMEGQPVSKRFIREAILASRGVHTALSADSIKEDSGK